jgi:hypothetical protein
MPKRHLPSDLAEVHLTVTVRAERAEEAESLLLSTITDRPFPDAVYITHKAFPGRESVNRFNKEFGETE